MTLRDRAAAALDNTHAAAARRLGLDTDKARDIVAAYLDGQKMRATTVRRFVAYLEMIGR
jgi:hypothetical protein